jgi:hypothetical protein
MGNDLFYMAMCLPETLTLPLPVDLQVEFALQKDPLRRNVAAGPLCMLSVSRRGPASEYLHFR